MRAIFDPQVNLRALGRIPRLEPVSAAAIDVTFEPPQPALPTSYSAEH